MDNQTFDLKGQASNKDWWLVKEENWSFVSVLYPSARIVCHQRVLNKVMFANYVPKSPEVWSHCLRKILFSPVIVQFGQLSPLAKKKNIFVSKEWFAAMIETTYTTQKQLSLPYEGLSESPIVFIMPNHSNWSFGLLSNYPLVVRIKTTVILVINLKICGIIFLLFLYYSTILWNHFGLLMDILRRFDRNQFRFIIVVFKPALL